MPRIIGFLRGHSAWTRLAPSAILAFLIVPSVCAQQSELDATASRLSGAMFAALRGSLAKRSVLVVDFTETHGGSDQLGAELAVVFSKALARHSQGFWVSDRDTYFNSFSIDRPGDRSRGASSEAECTSGQPKPTIVVDGYFDSLSDRIILRIKATRTTDSEIVFDERTALPLTPELQLLESKPLSPRVAPSGQEILAWVRPDLHMPNDGANAPTINPGDKSYTVPKCIDCPRAEYPDDALAAKIQGTIELRILIDTDGRPARIIILKGLPCGLNQKTIETVARWKLAPAKGPDGEPLAVWQDAEVTFQAF